MTRPDWDTYFIRIAKEVSSRATCKRAAVGAVLVKDNRILATGYNGAPAGEDHCTDEDCIMICGHCARTVHAEANTIYQAEAHDIPTIGTTLYYWDSKGRYAKSVEELATHCQGCGALVRKAGIARICGRGL